jgi:hypothetical protein
VDQDGYIITGSDENAATQYNLANPITGNDQPGWASYHAGEAQTPYDCGPCHTTGYANRTANAPQDDLPGIVGTWAEPGGARLAVNRDSEL